LFIQDFSFSQKNEKEEELSSFCKQKEESSSSCS
jgi:hypothetical protein